jgi:SAM-dependent methyltransferase
MKRFRPPVLAHERYLTDQANLERLGMADRFERIWRTNLWGAPNSVSGLGSETTATVALREALPDLLRGLGVRTLLDAPCGDAGCIATCVSDVAYIGVDIVPAIIRANAARGDIAGRFLLADITRDALPATDAVLCRDCLVHLSFAHIRGALDRFRATGAAWLLATTFPEWAENADCEDGDWRALNFQQAPFFWPTPRATINERCGEGDGGWDDKSLAVWRLSDLPDA